MGAGASAEYVDKIKDASQEEVTEALSGLSAEQKAQLKATLGEGAATEKAVPEEKAEEKAKPAESAAESAAPFLSQAFKCVADGFKKTLESAMTGEDTDPEQMEKEMQECMDKCRELLGKSFDHHDKKGDGVLDKEEAAVFFKNLLDANGAMFETIVETGVRIPLEQMIKDVKGCSDMAEEKKKAFIAEFKKAIQETVDAQKEATAKQVEEYKANREERDAKAFAIVDTSGDGTLQRAEFLEALKFGSEKNGSLMEALGIQMG